MKPRPTARRRNPEYDKNAYRRALAGDKNLEGANLQGARLARANLADANLAGANLRGARLADANLAGANLARAKLGYADLEGADLQGANLARANLAGAALFGANLAGANLAYADLGYADLEGADLQGARLDHARFARANLRGVNLAGANLAYADLGYADLESVNIEGANLTYANLESANLSGVNLQGANLEGARWDKLTRWPVGFVPPVLGEHLTLSDPTGSAAFRRWFGDSVVKDETGRPVVVYHGTRSGGFTVFDPAKADAHHPGFYFTNDLTLAGTYIGKVKTPLLDPALTGDAEGAYRLYIKMERPFIYDAEGRGWDNLHVPQFHFHTLKTFEVAHAAKAAGYDGVIFKNLRDAGGQGGYNGPADVYVVFDPRNIKSATANVGTYDPNDPDIRHNPRSSSRGARSTRKRGQRR